MSDRSKRPEVPSRNGKGRRSRIRWPHAREAERANLLIALIDRQRREHGTPPTELTSVDRDALQAQGFTRSEVERASSIVRTWERVTLKNHGRIGRDEGRIQAVLDQVARAWG